MVKYIILTTWCNRSASSNDRWDVRDTLEEVQALIAEYEAAGEQSSHKMTHHVAFAAVAVPT